MVLAMCVTIADCIGNEYENDTGTDNDSYDDVEEITTTKKKMTTVMTTTTTVMATMMTKIKKL